MPSETLKTRNLKKDFVVMSPKGTSEIWAQADFWEMAFNPKHKRNNRTLGYLVSEYEFDEDWSTWENHPNGDEFIFCLSGCLTFILERADGIKKIKLKTGSYIVIPKNTWHTAKVRESSRALFITWGYGTKHREAAS